MSDFSFNEEENARTHPTTGQVTGLSGLLIKRGIARDAQQADVILIGIIVICVVIISFLMFSSGNESIPLDADIDPETLLPYGAEVPS